MFRLNKIQHPNNLLDYYHLQNDEVSCKIYPNLGASLQQFGIQDTEIIQGIQPTEDHLLQFRRYYPSSFLFPFPGRIEGGNFEYEGNHYQLPTNEGGRDNAIHGFIAEAPFELTENSLGDEEALLNFQYVYDGTYPGFPFPSKLNIIYKVSTSIFEVRFTVTNTGNSSFPFGLGWHPYFKSENIETSNLQFKASEQLIGDENQIPTGTEPNQFRETIGDQVLDDGFILEEPTVILNATTYDMRMNTFINDHSYLQLYTPPSRTSIAIEPMTCEPNVLNSGNGLLKITPKETFEWKIQLQLRILHKGSF